MYEIRIIVNFCYVFWILREDGEWWIGYIIFFVWIFICLFCLFFYYDNYNENWIYFICYVDYVSIWWMFVEVILYDIMYMYLFYGFYLNVCLLIFFKLLGLSIVIF